MIYLNDKPVNTTVFPDNTSQVWKLPESDLNPNFTAIVKWEYSHEGEFLQLAQLKSLLDAHHVEAELEIRYLPYGRQDKPISNTATFALATFAKLLNTLNFKDVCIKDAHSAVATNLINNSTNLLPLREVRKVGNLTGTDLLCYPDQGALIKYSKMETPWAFVHGEKVREQSTGRILSYKLVDIDESGEESVFNPKNQSVLIVDDICDGGMTFILLAKELLKAGAKEVNLFVSHGIFSRGLSVLKEAGINRIFTQDGEASEIQNNITYRRL